MPATSPATSHSPPTALWIDARAVVLAEHDAILDETVYALNSMDVVYANIPVLAIEGLIDRDLVLMAMVYPQLRFRSDDPGSSMVYDESQFAAVQQTMEDSIGDHMTCYHCTIADLSLRSEVDFERLARTMAGRPDIFWGGLLRVI